MEEEVTNHILDLVRNEVLRLSSSSSTTSVALTASSELPPPSPCPACKGAHWLRDCTSPEGDNFCAQRKERNFKNVTGVEVWLTMIFSTTPRNLKPTIDSGATHSMCGEISLSSIFADAVRHPSAAGRRQERPWWSPA
ncbi:hypothetical protein RHOSPDRAFT_37454 [Rhodotorula sp. JG-1b]|nr:hypothetical protein RHOSPDRAFT_37454 [Rhodotorula sp. JG-1b]